MATHQQDAARSSAAHVVAFPQKRTQRPEGDDVLAEQAIVLGLPVFPCNIEKAPLTRSGFKDAVTDAESIRRMFAAPAAVLIGVPTGHASGAVVVDVDTKDGKRGGDWLNRELGRIPETRTHRTRSGGVHLLFSHPGIRIPNSSGKIAPGVDIRGDGGYIIVPPSPGYSVVVGAPLAPMPSWLIEEACREPPPPPPRKPWKAPRDMHTASARRLLALVEHIAKAREGTRHSVLFWAACRVGEAIASGEMPADVALPGLESAALACGLPEAEVRRTVADGYRIGASGGLAS